MRGVAAIRCADVDNLDEVMLLELFEKCEHYTCLVGRGSDGRETVQPLSKLAAVHLRGKHLTTVTLAVEHLKREVGPLLAGLPALLNGAAKKVS